MKFLLANILFKQNKWNSSISLFKSCIKNGFRVERSSQKMLYAYTKLGKVEEGSRFLINNILDEDFVLGMAFRFIKDWNNACTYLRKAYEQNPYSERIVDRYIRTLYDARYVSELIQLLKTKDIKS